MGIGRLKLDSYKGVLPYSSELFGVYQPMIGWRARRPLQWLAERNEDITIIDRLTDCFDDASRVTVSDADCKVHANDLQIAPFAGPKLQPQKSVLLTSLAQILAKLGYETKLPNADVWKDLAGKVETVLRTSVLQIYDKRSTDFCAGVNSSAQARREGSAEHLKREHALDIEKAIAWEAQVGAAVVNLVKVGQYELVEKIFYTSPKYDGEVLFKTMLGLLVSQDPLERFDPKGDLRNVSVSPIGVTHLYRQFFFELDTFLGSPVAHLYVPPGSTSEITEVSTRRTQVEKTVEQSTETVRKEEKSATDEDEISEAVKQENKQDMKLGVSSTVEQSWGTGNISATASIDMDRSQTAARDTTHKRMRQQSAKLSSEIRENYKTTFKITTEDTDTVSKRYVISNPSTEMMNYELRRKMRQVAVQVQDVGTYLCWDSFVDEPGIDLGLSNLVHVARPADLIPRPTDLTLADLLPVDIPFTANGVWDYNTRMGNLGDQFVKIGSVPVPPGPDGYELFIPPLNKPTDPHLWLSQISASGDGFHQVWAYAGKFNGANIDLGVWTKPTGIGWDERVDFVLQGSVRYLPSAAKKAEIEAARNARTMEQKAVDDANARLTEEAFFTSARERIEQAHAVASRKYEDLREEERIVVYRRLISSLMTKARYQDVELAEGEVDSSRHILSTLINTIFDIDKMLYFVAPEWWKPRNHARLGIGYNDLAMEHPEALVTWDDGRQRDSNYLITDKSLPAAKGSSLGWLLQLDGDDLRNAFLNAPWVKAVIPVRPGREKAAINWLKSVGIEGANGLGDSYGGASDEKTKIREALGLASDHDVTVQDAIDYLCKLVEEKHAEGNEVKTYPDSEIDDSNKVLATPIERVYEHGFYPLQGGFRIDPSEAGADPNNQDKNFQIFDQWIEILPTDQIVPVAVRYNPITGRMIAPEDQS